jgi:Tfp pilus assembly protein PilV
MRVINGRWGGFTLIEAMLASLVLGISVVGIGGVLATSYQQGVVRRETANAMSLGKQLMDEIVALPLANPSTGSETLGPGTGETSRSQYTCICNYSGYSDTSTAIPTITGGTVDATGADVYKRSVTVTIGVKPSIDSASPKTAMAEVAVTVTTPTGAQIQMSRLVFNYAISR